MAIDLFHNGGQIKYSSVVMLICLSSLATTSKFHKNVCFKMRAVGLIYISTKESKSGRRYKNGLWLASLRWANTRGHVTATKKNLCSALRRHVAGTSSSDKITTCAHMKMLRVHFPGIYCCDMSPRVN